MPMFSVYALFFEGFILFCYSTTTVYSFNQCIEAVVGRTYVVVVDVLVVVVVLFVCLFLLCVWVMVFFVCFGITFRSSHRRVRVTFTSDWWTHPEVPRRHRCLEISLAQSAFRTADLCPRRFCQFRNRWRTRPSGHQDVNNSISEAYYMY